MSTWFTSTGLKRVSSFTTIIICKHTDTDIFESSTRLHNNLTISLHLVCFPEFSDQALPKCKEKLIHAVYFKKYTTRDSKNIASSIVCGFQPPFLGWGRLARGGAVVLQGGALISMQNATL